MYRVLSVGSKTFRIKHVELNRVRVNYCLYDFSITLPLLPDSQGVYKTAYYFSSVVQSMGNRIKKVEQTFLSVNTIYQAEISDPPELVLLYFNDDYV